MNSQTISKAAIVLLGVLIIAPARLAHALPVELITNGGFETGNFLGWGVINQLGSLGTFFIDNDVITPISAHPTVGPASGTLYAVSDQTGRGAHALFQVFTINTPITSAILSFDMFVNDWDSGPVINPAGLTYLAGPNQHGRVDILSAGAPLFDTGAGVLDNFYLGVDGSGPHPYISYSFDITSLVAGGGAFVLRFAEVDTLANLNMGVDNVSVQIEPSAAPVPEPSAMLLLGSGIAGLAGMRRRNNT